MATKKVVKKKKVAKKKPQIEKKEEPINIENVYVTKEPEKMKGRRVIHKRTRKARYPIIGAIVFLIGMAWLLFSLLTCFGTCSLTVPIIIAIVGIILLIIGV